MQNLLFTKVADLQTYLWKKKYQGFNLEIMDKVPKVLKRALALENIL